MEDSNELTQTRSSIEWPGFKDTFRELHWRKIDGTDQVWRPGGEKFKVWRNTRGNVQPVCGFLSNFSSLYIEITSLPCVPLRTPRFLVLLSLTTCAILAYFDCRLPIEAGNLLCNHTRWLILENSKCYCLWRNKRGWFLIKQNYYLC